MTPPSVLVVDDDTQLARALRIALRGSGYAVVTAGTAAAALAKARGNEPDLVLLDLGLPDGDGTSVILGLRSWSNVPIIVMSGRRTSNDKVTALDLGADDYVVKPFRTDELLARMRAHWRRQPPGESENSNPEPVKVGLAIVDLAAHRVTRDGADIRLTPTEWHLLERLIGQPDKLLTARDLLTGLRAGPTDEHGSYLRVYMSQLRRKLEPDPTRPRHLLTEPGLGYRFRPGPGSVCGRPTDGQQSRCALGESHGDESLGQ
jgi:two-component system, OmpR family, KDP operon response regulator KdpE